MDRNRGLVTERGFGRGNGQGLPLHIGGEFHEGGFPRIPPPPGGVFLPVEDFKEDSLVAQPSPPPISPLVVSRAALFRASKARLHTLPQQVLLAKQMYNSSRFKCGEAICKLECLLFVRF